MPLRFVAESSVETPELRRGEVDLEANANCWSATRQHPAPRNVGETRLVIVVLGGAPSPVSRPSPRKAVRRR